MHGGMLVAMRYPLGLGLLLALLCLAAGCTQSAARSRDAESVPVTLRLLERSVKGSHEALQNSGQILVVAYDPGTTRTRISLMRPDSTPGSYAFLIPEFDGAVGKNGVARPGEKREGDKMTPSGLFTLTEAFGADPVPPTRLPYRVVTDEDAWSEDPTSPAYNSWVKVPKAEGGDRLKREDDLYFHALVVDYNRNPVVPGLGSAIFIHKADPFGAGTLGCVGMRTEDLDRVLAALDPAMHPTILIGRVGSHSE